MWYNLNKNESDLVNAFPFRLVMVSEVLKIILLYGKNNTGYEFFRSLTFDGHFLYLLKDYFFTFSNKLKD